MKLMRCIVPVMIALAATPGFPGENTGRLAGKVVDINGKPIAGVKMTLKRLDITWSRELKVDAKGNWIQVGLEVKEFELLVTAPGFEDHKETVKVPLGETKRVDITMYTAEQAREKAMKEGKAVDKGEGEEAAATEAFNTAVFMYNEQNYVGALPFVERAYTKLGEAIAKVPEKETETKAKLNESIDKVERVYAVCLFEAGKADETKRKEYWTKAEPMIQKTLQRDPKNGRGLTYMVEISNGKGDAAGAAAYQARLDALIGPNPGVAYNQGVEAYNANKFKEAKPFFQKAIQIDPKYAEAYYLLAMCEFNEMNLKATKVNLQKYLELAPTGKNAQMAKEMLADPTLKNVK